MKLFRDLTVASVAALLGSQAFAGAAFESGDDGWQLSVGAYLITQNIEADSTVSTPGGGSSTIPVSLDFGDVLDNENGLGSLFMRLGDGHWGVELDYAFVNLENKPNAVIGPLTLNKIEFGVETLELIATYRIRYDGYVIDWLFGARYTDHEIDITQTITPPSPSGAPSQTLKPSFGDSWVDPIVGARAIGPISNTNWFYTSRFDIGGFGVGSDLTWRADLGVGYKWQNGWQAVAKYKYVNIDFDNDSSSNLYIYDGYEHGVLLGAAYTY